MWKIQMSSPIVHWNLNIRENRKCGEISLPELRKSHMICNYNRLLIDNMCSYKSLVRSTAEVKQPLKNGEKKSKRFSTAMSGLLSLLYFFALAFNSHYFTPLMHELDLPFQ